MSDQAPIPDYVMNAAVQFFAETGHEGFTHVRLTLATEPGYPGARRYEVSRLQAAEYEVCKQKARLL